MSKKALKVMRIRLTDTEEEIQYRASILVPKTLSVETFLQEMKDYIAKAKTTQKK